MTLIAWFLVAGLLITGITLAVTMANLSRFRLALDAPAPDAETLVSICVPARNEEDNIEACVRSLLAQDHANIEVLVYDDQSDDRTPEILAGLVAADGRVRAVEAVPLPSGWSGKQHACDRMGRVARGDWVLFTDADVRFEPGAVRRTLAEAEKDRPHGPVDLVSAFPRELTGSPGEALLVPTIFFLLMGYLPLGQLRSTTNPGTSAGCGQYLFVRRGPYLEAGGHAAFKDSYHDGIRLPRLIRSRGGRTDLFDAFDLCSVRMYRGLAESWRGFAKNAYEGLGSPGLLIFLTVLHAVAHLLPWGVLVWAVASLSDLVPGPGGVAFGLAMACAGLQGVQRDALSTRFGHPRWLIAAHPVSIAMMLGVQWHSFLLSLRGKRSWRGRTLGEGDPVAGGAS